MTRALLAIAALAAVSLAEPARAEGRRGTGKATFRHGSRTYRLPVENVGLEEVRAAGRTEVHVALVFRDARNRLLALAFVHRGPGPASAGGIDLTASTPSGVSRYDARRSRCDIEVAGAGPAFVEGTARCHGLTDFGGDGSAPDVTDLRFRARAPAPAALAPEAATRKPRVTARVQVGLPVASGCAVAGKVPRSVAFTRSRTAPGWAQERRRCSACGLRSSSSSS